MAQQFRNGRSFRKPMLGCKHPHGSSQPSVTPVTGNLITSSGSKRTMNVHGAHIYMQAEHPCILNKSFFKRNEVTFNVLALKEHF